MAPISPYRKPTAAAAASRRHLLLALMDAALWPCTLIFITLILFCSLRDVEPPAVTRSGPRFGDRPCDEFYVVGEGDTLHSISDKCRDPFILEENPHIHDPDDVFPGLVIKITQSNNKVH